MKKYFLIFFTLVLMAAFVHPCAYAMGKPAVMAKLKAKAQAKGSARVIIRMKETTADSSTLASPSGRSARKQSMGNLRQQFLNKPSHKSWKMKGLKQFDYLPLLAMEADSTLLTQLENDPDVLSVEEDIATPPVLSDSIPLIKADVAKAQGFDGTGWTVAILDTGVDTSHAMFSGRVVSEACYSTQDSGNNRFSVCPSSVTESTATGSGVHCNKNDSSLNNASCDHGTHVAGIAVGNGAQVGVAPAANLITIQVFTKFTSSSDCGATPTPCVLSFTSDQIKGLERVLALKDTYNIASANLSLGGGQFFSNCDGSLPSTKAAIDNLRSAGIATTISSGNDGFTTSISGPACISTAISVGATSKSDGIASFSNGASFLTILAPGVSIVSAVPGGTGTKSGTSMAAPHVAGAWAVLKQAVTSFGQTGSVDSILSLLNNTGTSITDSRSGTAFTFSRIDVGEAVAGFVVRNPGVVVPFWQWSNPAYTFVAITHPSLAGMSTEIGVRATAFLGDGTSQFGTAQEFTVSAGETARLFIFSTPSSNPLFQTTNFPTASVILGTQPGGTGSIRFDSIATAPNLADGNGNFPDITHLSFWGAIVVSGLNTGFAMEFIGDLQDSAAHPGMATNKFPSGTN